MGIRNGATPELVEQLQALQVLACGLLHHLQQARRRNRICQHERQVEHHGRVGGDILQHPGRATRHEGAEVHLGHRHPALQPELPCCSRMELTDHTYVGCVTLHDRCPTRMEARQRLLPEVQLAVRHSGQ